MFKKYLYRVYLFFKRFFFRLKLKKKKVRISSNSKGYLNVSFEGKNDVPKGCHFSGKIKIGKSTTLGYNNFIAGNVRIGKYCQLASDVAIHSTNHPVNYLSTYINFHLFEGALNKLKEVHSVNIGNDVWIGHGVKILGNVTIGNGAIIGAGSVVTKNVEAYTIVAGVPANPIKKRFSEEVIKEIEDLKWWDKEEEELYKIKSLFLKNYENSKTIYD